MTYAMTTIIKGDLESFRKVTERAEPHATGLIARCTGLHPDGLALTAIWESKADSDRWTAEHLVPAIKDLLDLMPANSPLVEFEAIDENFPVRARS